IGTLIVLSALLRSLRLGAAGAFAVLVLATAPLMVRYSTYARPYALPLFWMMLFAYAVHRYLGDGRRGWLRVAIVTAVALPLTRVPEPTVFLATTVAVLVLLSYRRRLPWARTWPLIAASGGSLVFLCVPMYLILAAHTESFFDPSPAGVVDRFGAGVHEMVTAVPALLATSFPWWPITVLAILAAFAVPASRRLLFQWWMWWPLLAGPVAFLLAYHFVNPFPFDTLPYRARALYFFLPAFALAIAALSAVLGTAEAASPRLRIALAVLLGGVLVGQLPSTVDVVLLNAAPDFGAASHMLTTDLPADAIVLYDRPSPAGQSRQPFLGTPRYMGETPYVATVSDLGAEAASIPRDGPVYLLINGQCAYSGRCRPIREPWDERVPGWRLADRIERFTLYEPVQGQSGPTGVVSAMRAFGSALGPELAYVETFTAATLLKEQGHAAQGKTLINQMYSQATPDVARRIRDAAAATGLDPFT
ncbi:MAG: hypothetical protein H0V07_10260, partial [Propionibacteriales bacterium]|nr:hypothetical protein [Propionibacteriales bacterium]